LSSIDLPPASLSVTSYTITVRTRNVVPTLTLFPLPLWSLSTARLSALRPPPVSMMIYLSQMFVDGLSVQYTVSPLLGVTTLRVIRRLLSKNTVSQG